MKHTDLIAIEEMPYEEKVIQLFKIFPTDTLYASDLLDSIQRVHKKGINFYSIAESYYSLDMYVDGLGSFKKLWGINVIRDVREYSFSFYIGDSVTKGLDSDSFSKEESNILCERALPFMVSYGHNKDGIPLIIHDFPKFAKFALGYVP